MANIQGEQSLVQKAKNTKQVPPISELVNDEKNTLVIHASKNKSSEEINSEQNISENKDLDNEHPTKKLNSLINYSTPHHPTTLQLLPESQHLRETNLKEREMKRLAYHKAEKEKLEESLRKILNPANVRAQTHKLAEYEAKKAKMLKEYNDFINLRADELPATKISSRISLSHDATMRITRGNDPLNVVVHNNFRLNSLAFVEWLDVHAIASKIKSKSNDQLLKTS
ncbi:hypothetical protein Tco_0010858 [Tanacetum coccineum]